MAGIVWGVSGSRTGVCIYLFLHKLKSLSVLCRTVSRSAVPIFKQGYALCGRANRYAVYNSLAYFLCNTCCHVAQRFFHSPLRKIIMNKDQIKGTVKGIAGKAQQIAGKTINNKEMQFKGLHKQAVGHAEKALGDAKEGIKNARDKIKRDINSH
jgi:uncharacterized protein YjbJ (UPF0337 family)